MEEKEKEIHELQISARFGLRFGLRAKPMFAKVC